MRLGVGTYTFAWAAGVPGFEPSRPLTALGLLEQATRLDVGVVQFCDNLPLSELSSEQLEAVASYAQEHRLQIELGTRGIADRENLLAHLELARRFRTPFVRVVVDSRGFEPSPAETVETLKPVMTAFAAEGIRLAIENHDRFTCDQLAWVIDQLGREAAGICLDTVNSFGALEGPETVIGKLGPYALNLHVKDFNITRVGSQMGFTVTGAPAGTGRLDVPRVLGELRSHGRDVNAIIELWTPFGPDLEATLKREAEWAEQSVRFMRTLIPD